jgi:predicted O-methyltransferase YrrM
MSMARGFQAAKLLMVAVEYAVFDFLEEPRSAVEAASWMKTDERATGIMLNALASLGVLVKGVDYFHNGETASRYLVRGKEDYRGAIIRHMHHTMRGWSELEATLHTGHPPELDPQKWVDSRPERSEEEVRDSIWGMHAVARDLAPQVTAKIDLAGVRHLLDLGGGPATYAITFAQAHPALKATVFDLPNPIEIARENIAKHGLGSRIGTLAGNFLKDDIGRGYDFIWVSQIFHSHNEEQCRLIIAKTVQALNPGGRLAIQDFFLNDDGYTPPGAAMFCAHMLAVTPRGRSYYHREVAEWLEEAGLTPPQHIPSSPDASILVARKK